MVGGAAAAAVAGLPRGTDYLHPTNSLNTVPPAGNMHRKYATLRCNVTGPTCPTINKKRRTIRSFIVGHVSWVFRFANDSLVT